MGTYRYTSKTNFVLIWCLFLFGVLLFAYFMSYLHNGIEIAIPGLSPDTAELGAFCFAFAYTLVLAGCSPGDPDISLSGITAYIYGNIVLRAGLSWQDAKQLSEMFAPGSYNHWYPMDEITKLPRKTRRDAIFSIAVRVDRLSPNITKDLLVKQALIRIPTFLLAAAAYPFALSILASYGKSELVTSRLIEASIPVVIIVFFLASTWILSFKQVEK